jgi:hypothetical protein
MRNIIRNIIFTFTLKNAPVLGLTKTIDSFDDGESFGADVAGLMKKAKIKICLKYGATKYGITTNCWAKN